MRHCGSPKSVGIDGVRRNGLKLAQEKKIKKSRFRVFPLKFPKTSADIPDVKERSLFYPITFPPGCALRAGFWFLKPSESRFRSGTDWSLTGWYCIENLFNSAPGKACYVYAILFFNFKYNWICTCFLLCGFYPSVHGYWLRIRRSNGLGAYVWQFHLWCYAVSVRPRGFRWRVRLC